MAISIEDALDKEIKCGIWAGRFQYVHNGHHYVFKNILSKFPEQMVGIVHPFPYYETRELATLEGETFQRFGVDLNPFNYFQRMLLWRTIAIEEKRDVSIVPCWHPRVSLSLENEFLPYAGGRSSRCWIVPIGQDDNERRKMYDLESKGEIVCDSHYGIEEPSLRAISASQVRQYRDENDLEEFRKSVPPCIQQLTLDLANQNETYEYRVVPVIDDEIDFASLQYAIEWAKLAHNRFVIVAITVGVSNPQNTVWWYKSALRLGSGYTYYQKMKQMEQLFKSLNFIHYLITPIFVQENNIGQLSDYWSAFLPTKYKWVINTDITYRYSLVQYLRGIPSMYEKINRKRNILTEENYDLFSKEDVIVKQLTSNDTNTVRHAKRLKTAIENSLPINAAQNSILSRFTDYPDRLIMLINRWEYNAISESDLSNYVQQMEKDWNDK